MVSPKHEKCLGFLILVTPSQTLHVSLQREASPCLISALICKRKQQSRRWERGRAKAWEILVRPQQIPRDCALPAVPEDRRRKGRKGKGRGGRKSLLLTRNSFLGLRNLCQWRFNKMVWKVSFSSENSQPVQEIWWSPSMRYEMKPPGLKYF